MYQGRNRISEFDWSFNYISLVLFFLFYFLYSMLDISIWRSILRKMSVNQGLSISWKILASTNLNQCGYDKVTQSSKIADLWGKGDLQKVASESRLLGTSLKAIGGFLAFLCSLLFWRNEPLSSEMYLLFLSTALTFLVLCPLLLERLINIGLAITKNAKINLNMKYTNGIAISFLYCISWWIIGLAYYFLLGSFHRTDLISYPIITGTAAVAWIGGCFSLLPVTGLGVKEGIFSLFLSFYLPVTIAIVISLVIRIWTTAIESVHKAITLLIVQHGGRRIAAYVLSAFGLLLTIVYPLQQRFGESGIGASDPRAEPVLSTWTKSDFEGKKMDYAYWLKAGYGEYNVDDDDTPETNPLVNDALLWLAFRDPQAHKRYHDLLMRFYYDEFPFLIKKGERRLAAIIESYIYMRDENAFTIREQKKLENWFKRLTYLNRKKSYRCLPDNIYRLIRHPSHIVRNLDHVLRDFSSTYINLGYIISYPMGAKQAGSAGLNAVTGYMLDSSLTGVDHSQDVKNMWDFAKTARTFDDTYAPPENSAHYAAYIIASMLRIAIYTDHGYIIQNNRENFRRCMDWIMKIMPHNGFVPSFGTTWFKDHVFPYVEILHAGAHYLNDSRYKWLATQMFKYGLEHNPADRVEVNPIWIWKYVDDSLPMVEPSVKDYGCEAVYRYVGYGYYNAWDGSKLDLKLDKIILRDSWGSEGFYLQIEAAPKCYKNEPYANSITNFVYGGEAFSSDHRLEEPSNQGWEQRNVVGPPPERRIDAVLNYLHNFDSYVAVSTSAGKWIRQVGMVKLAYTVVFDFVPYQGTAYWHLQGTPMWHSDYVELVKGSNQLNVYYPHYGWYSVSYFDKYTWNSQDYRDGYWYVGDPSRELELHDAKTWAVLLFPYRGELPIVTAVTPKIGDSEIYPYAIGLKLVQSSYTDWHGASHTDGEIKYDLIQTDAEIFWARETNVDWTISFVDGRSFRIPVRLPPKSILFEGVPNKNWDYTEGLLTFSPPRPKGTIKILK